MSTAQGGTLSSVLYVIVLVLCLTNAYRQTGARPLRRPTPIAVAVWLTVAVPSLVQLAVPAVFRAFERRPDAVEHGEVWRLLTSMIVQDGGVVGTTFNLVALALTVSVATAIWRPRTALALLVIGGFTFNLLATFAWHDAGGGNSAATFFLATATPGLLAGCHSVHGVPRTTATVLAAGIVLLAIGDAHGVPVLLGLATGFLVGTQRTKLSPSTKSRRDLTVIGGFARASHERHHRS